MSACTMIQLLPTNPKKRPKPTVLVHLSIPSNSITCLSSPLVPTEDRHFSNVQCFFFRLSNNWVFVGSYFQLWTDTYCCSHECLRQKGGVHWWTWPVWVFGWVSPVNQHPNECQDPGFPGSTLHVNKKISVFFFLSVSGFNLVADWCGNKPVCVYSN